MGFYADPWLREARDRIKSFPERSAVSNDLGYVEFDKLADAVEKAIKAALIENHGSIPRKHDHNKLVSLCEATGVWDVLPPALRNLVQKVESYRLTNTVEAYGPASLSSSPEQLQKYFSVARRLIDYMEFHVIGNDSILRRLKVA
jgi:HEPN domain-containing protein